MHFGPEWMRPKHPLRPQNPPSPPPNTHAPSGASSYSALLTPSLNSTQESSDAANPFLYSKEDLLKIYKDGGGRGGLGLEVERWEGVVREVGSEPVTLKEWTTEGERKVLLTSMHAVTHHSSSPALRRFDQFRGASASVKRLHIAPCEPIRRKAEVVSQWIGNGGPSEREVRWPDEKEGRYRYGVYSSLPNTEEHKHHSRRPAGSDYTSKTVLVVHSRSAWLSARFQLTVSSYARSSYPRL